MKKWIKYWMILFLGVLLGASLANVLIGKQIDYLHMSNEFLRQKLSVSERELQAVQESLQQRGQQSVTGIDVKIDFATEKLTSYEESMITLTVEESIDQWLKLIKGQNIEDLNYMLIPQIIDGREIKVDGRQFSLKVKLVVIMETVVIFLEIKPTPQGTR